MNFEQLTRDILEELNRSQSLRGRGTLDHEADLILKTAWSRMASEGKAPPAPASVSYRLEPANISVPDAVEELARDWTEKRARGILLQHVLGEWHFLDHTYRVGPEVLIPRPETEVLVEELSRELGRSWGANGNFLGAEIGVGSGIISIELLSRFSGLSMVGTDISAEALTLSRENATTLLGLQRAQRDFDARLTDSEESPCQALEAILAGKKPQFIVSNPPYLDPGPSSEEVQDEVRAQEPHLALFAPAEDLLYFYGDIAEHGPYLLAKDGLIALEIPHERAGQLRDLYETFGYQVRMIQDLTGRDRVLIARCKQE